MGYLDLDGLKAFWNGLKSKFDSKSDVGHKHPKSDITDFPVFLVQATNGFDGAICSGADGVAEVGKYLDFHDTNAGGIDFNTRLVNVNSSSTAVMVNLPQTNGTIVVGDNSYSIVKSSTAPASNTPANVITLVV